MRTAAVRGTDPGHGSAIEAHWRLSAALLAAACSGETKDATPPGEPIALMHLQAKMRDGIRLDTSVWLPATTGKFPVVLTRTPYDSEMGEIGRAHV